MHASLVKTPASKSSLNGLAIVTDKGEEVDTDQILPILMELQKDGARRDEKLTYISSTLAEMAHSGEVRSTAINGKLDMALEEVRQIKSRVKVLEDANLLSLTERVTNIERSGIRGFLEGSTAKRLGTLTGLVIGIAALIAILLSLFAWLKTHVHF